MTDEGPGAAPPPAPTPGRRPALTLWVGWLLLWTVVMGVSSAFLVHDSHQSHLRKVRQCVDAGRLTAATTSVPEIVAECELDPSAFSR